MTSRPLRCVGAISEMSKGQTHEAMPTPRPRIARPAVIVAMLCATAWMTAPAMNVTSASINRLLRPILSDVMPAAMPPMRAPPVVMEAMSSLSPLVRVWPKPVPILTRMPPINPHQWRRSDNETKLLTDDASIEAKEQARDGYH